MKQLFTLLTIGLSFCGFSQNELLIPSAIEDTNISLTLQNGTHQFFAGESTATMGANGNVLAPTLIINKNDDLNINVTNNLGEQTTIHWHGMHISAINDGGPHTIIEPGATWNPQFTVLNNASTMWYHPHLLDKTDEHVSKGLAGMIIIKDNVEAALNLPRTYGVDDIPLVIQTKDFDNNFEIIHLSNSDNVVTVNATVNPFVELPAQVVRLRLLNGSSQRSFNLGFSGDRTFYEIATDGGLIASSLPLTRLEIAPGERFEILVDLAGLNGQTLQLKSYASELTNGVYGATFPGANTTLELDNYNPNPLNGADFNLLQIDVVAQTVNPVTTVINNLVTITPYEEVDSDENRDITFSSITGGLDALNGGFTINGESMDMSAINITIPLENTEIWTIQNGTPIGHPFHIHDIQFYILDIDFGTVPDHLKGWKDTVYVKSGSIVRVITKFEDFANDTVPFMYHCHMLKHEDDGMMGQFVVIDENAGVNDFNLADGFTIFPNPSNGVYMTAKLFNDNELITAYAVVNELGQIVSYHKIHENEMSNLYSFPVFEYSTGIYALKIYTEHNIYTQKFIKQ